MTIKEGKRIKGGSTSTEALPYRPAPPTPNKNPLPTQSDPEAMRYGFDGFGYKYIDSGSGSDWRTRHPDAEPLYASQPTQSDALREENERLREALRRCDEIVKSWNFRQNEKVEDVRFIVRAALQEQSK